MKKGLIMSAHGIMHFMMMMTEMTGPGVAQVKRLVGTETGVTVERDAKT